jgi:hypothetical protein
MNAAPAKSNAHVVFSRTNGGGARTSAHERRSAAGPRTIQTGVTRETYLKEEWLPLASTDPALWLK